MKTGLLLSGGMDSISIAYWYRPEILMTIDYGHRAAAGEIRAATAVAKELNIEHHVLAVDLCSFGSGDMASSEPLRIAPIPEWWPFRNQMLVTLAAMKGVSLSIGRLLIGSLKTDASHADGRPDFVQTLDSLLRLQEGNIVLEAPAIALTAIELIRKSNVPSPLLAWAHSCHVDEYACGLCRGCRKHYETLRDLGEAPY